MNEDLKRAVAQAEARNAVWLDQAWAAVRDTPGAVRHVLRIADTGPRPGDEEFVSQMFSILLGKSSARVGRELLDLAEDFPNG